MTKQPGITNHEPSVARTSHSLPRTNSEPKVSVVLPVYNGQKYLPESIESILEQSFPDFELLILDDGSTDSSIDIAKSYSNQDDRVKHIILPRSGLVSTLNHGISLSRGPYIARMDADDIALPDRLSSQLLFLDTHLKVGVVGSFAEVISPTGETLGYAKTGPTSKDAFLEQLTSGEIISLCHPSIMMRRSIAVQLNGYRQEYFPAEDLDLWNRMAEVTQVETIPKVLLKYRLHDGSISIEKGLASAELVRRIQYNMVERRSSRPELDSAEFRELEAAQGWLRRSMRWADARSGYHYRTGVGRVAAGQLVGSLQILWSFILNPKLLPKFLARVSARSSVSALFKRAGLRIGPS